MRKVEEVIFAICLVVIGGCSVAIWYDYHPEQRHTVTETIYRVLGDVNGDQRCDQIDMDIIKANWGMEKPTYGDGDLNDDGKIDEADLNIAGKYQGNGRKPAILLEA